MVERAFDQMGRESSDQVVTHSSIALLQERFRQLQREKEMRQGRELLRTSLGSGNNNPTAQHEPSKLFFKSEILIPPARPLCQASLSLWPIETPEPMKFSWAADKPFVRAPPIRFNDSDSDVDTSLHL